jgi:hypothetical protein
LAVLLFFGCGAVAGLTLRVLPRACLLIAVVLIGLLAVWVLFVVLDNPDPDPECGSTLLNLLPCSFLAGVTEAACVTALGVGAGLALGAAAKGPSRDGRGG